VTHIFLNALFPEIAVENESIYLLNLRYIITQILKFVTQQFMDFTCKCPLHPAGCLTANLSWGEFVPPPPQIQILNPFYSSIICSYRLTNQPLSSFKFYETYNLKIPTATSGWKSLMALGRC
jgi:hypothetical protein